MSPSDERARGNADAGATPVFRLTAASVGYGDRPTVRDVDLVIRAGEVVALIGPNGSGKTTLVRGILGLARIMAGRVEIFGVPAADFAERYRIGYVPQRHTVGGAIPSTVEEVVASGRLPRKSVFSRTTRQDRTAVRDAIATVGLVDQRRTPVATLSGGQQRRVLIARALASEPDVLVMDEPTAGVDTASQEGLVATLDQLVQQGLTLLIVTHEIRPLMSILTRAVALQDGLVVADIPVEAAGVPPGPSPVPTLADLLAPPAHDDSHDDLADPTASQRWLRAPRIRG